MKAACFFFLFPLSAFPQIISGVVKDAQSGTVLPGAHVYLLNDKTVGTASDSLGRFSIQRKTSGDTLVISFIGYAEHRISPGDVNEILVWLKPDNQYTQEIIIKGERLIAEEFTIRKITKLEIYTDPSAKADPILAVNSTPAATTIDESANISLRGSSPAETGIFLNNVPINDAVRYSQLNGIGTFSIFNTALVNNVQVYPGNPPLEFGNTTSGLIALQTDEVIPSKPVNSVSLTLASMGFYTQRKLSTKSSLTAFGNVQPSTIIKALNRKALERIKAFNSFDLGLHYLLRPDSKTVVKIFNYSLRESYQFRFEQPTYSGVFHQQKYRNFTIMNYRRKTNRGEFTINNGLSFSTGNYQYSVMNLKIKLNDVYTSVNYQHSGNTFEFKTGVSYDFKASTFNGVFPEFSYAVGDQYPTDSSMARQDVKLPEGYVYAKYFISPKWIVGAGVRKSVPVEGRGEFLSTQINLNFKPTREFNIIAAAGRYNKFQLPQGESNEPYAISSEQYSLDIKYAKPDKEFSVSVFYKQGDQPAYLSEVRGMEVYGRQKFNRNLKGQLSLTSLQATNESQGERRPSPYNIHYFIRGNVEYKFLDTWTLTTVFLFRQGSYYRPVTGTTFDSTLGVYQPEYGLLTRLPSYNTIDLSISKLFMIRNYTAVAFCGLGNLFDFKNINSYIYNFDYSDKTPFLFSQRAVYFGLIVNF